MRTVIGGKADKVACDGVWWVSLRLGRNRPYHYDIFTSFAMLYKEGKKK